MQKAIIKKEYKDILLASQLKMAAIADGIGVQVQTVQKHIIADSPKLTEVLTLQVIQKVLEVSEDTIIYDIIPVGDKHLHHD